jgi:hypothetical protein
MVACQVFFQFAGCPREFWCDQSGAFNSDSFRAFAEALGIKICYSSAEYPQSNGAAESAVKFLKRLRAAAATVFDLFRAILYLQNTVKRAKSASPAQICSWGGRSALPSVKGTAGSQRPASWTSHFEERIADQHRMKTGYDTVGMREHVNMCLVDLVLVHNVRGKSQPGTVVQQLPTPRTYLVEFSNGARSICNRYFLTPLPRSPPSKAGKPSRMKSTSTSTRTAPDIVSTRAPSAAPDRTPQGPASNTQSRTKLENELRRQVCLQPRSSAVRCALDPPVDPGAPV